MTVEDVVCRLLVTGIVVSLAINSLFLYPIYITYVQLVYNTHTKPF